MTIKKNCQPTLFRKCEKLLHFSQNHTNQNGHAGHSHGHGHGHGHSHELPKSVSAVAWMVIMGDGLHNFCDGLAIGKMHSVSYNFHCSIEIHMHWFFTADSNKITLVIF